MRQSRAFIPTLKESPADAEVASHRLLVRGGFMRKVASGIYDFLPLGTAVLHRITAIIREEMNAAGAQEVILPILQPRELWEESGRWSRYGQEMMRLKDRAGREFGLGPTHEEIITDLVRGNTGSYRDLPLNLYQIGPKYRDELRPRFGLLRGREFLMKDGYSFDRDEAGMRVRVGLLEVSVAHMQTDDGDAEFVHSSPPIPLLFSRSRVSTAPKRRGAARTEPLV